MLIVKSYGLLNSGIGDSVAVSQVFGDDSGTRLVFLRDVLALDILSSIGRLWGFRGNVFNARGRGDMNLRRAELGVVEEQSGFSCTVTSINIAPPSMVG